MNRFASPIVLTLGLFVYVESAVAEEPFSGTWAIDLRTPTERQRGAECGTAEFVLKQVGDTVTGTHSMSTSDCGRINEEGPVKGVVVGMTAVLVVTSERNDAIVMGTAKRSKEDLQWRQAKEIKAGSTEGDSSLILDNGLLAPVWRPDRKPAKEPLAYKRPK